MKYDHQPDEIHLILCHDIYPSKEKDYFLWVTQYKTKHFLQLQDLLLLEFDEHNHF